MVTLNVATPIDLPSSSTILNCLLANTLDGAPVASSDFLGIVRLARLQRITLLLAALTVTVGSISSLLLTLALVLN